MLIAFLMKRIRKIVFVKGFATGLVECKIFIKLVHKSSSRTSCMYLRLDGEGGFPGNQRDGHQDLICLVCNLQKLLITLVYLRTLPCLTRIPLGSLLGTYSLWFHPRPPSPPPLWLGADSLCSQNNQHAILLSDKIVPRMLGNFVGTLHVLIHLILAEALGGSFCHFSPS